MPAGWASAGTTTPRRALRVDATFAVQTIRRWWQEIGRERYPCATRLTITQPCQALKADRLGDVQVDDQRAQRGPERRAGCEPLRRCGGDALAAAGTDAAMAVDAGDDRADRRQLDMIVGTDLGLVGGAERMGAVRAGRGFLAGGARLGFCPFDGGR